MRNLMRCFVSIVSTSAVGMGGAACGEIPPLEPAELQAAAGYIFTGKIMRIYSTVDRSSSELEFTYSVAEVQVDKVEKGEHKSPLAYVRFWSKRHTGTGAPLPDYYGHRDVPKAGSQTRVFVEKAKDGGYDVLDPNGFSTIKRADKKG